MDNNFIYVPGLSEEVMSQVEIEQKNNHEQFITNTGAVKKITKQQKGDKTIIRKEDDRQSIDIPVWKKYALTIKEASNYYNISEFKLKEFLQTDVGRRYALKVANRLLVKRALFEQYLESIETM